MCKIIGDCIVSALGFTTGENYSYVRQGVTGLKFYDNKYAMSEPFMASLISDELLDSEFEAVAKEFSRTGRGNAGDAGAVCLPYISDYAKFEKAAIVSIAKALAYNASSASSERTLFVLSTTKGNVSMLREALDVSSTASPLQSPEGLYLWRSAALIARFFNNCNAPVVVSNACISGASALLAAQRELRSGRYDKVVVTGADMMSEFIVTGFQSFKALSSAVCKPFDASHCGLNIGEAAATIVLSAEAPRKDEIELVAGAVCNDANHISGPSRTGEGAFLSLMKTLQHAEPEALAFVNAHGTATPYNDDMETIALTRAGLNLKPVNSLKGYFGHTLGAAGVLECIISARSLADGVVCGTYGFENRSGEEALNVSNRTRNVAGNTFIKMLSGFGGCNAALLFRKAS